MNDGNEPTNIEDSADKTEIDNNEQEASKPKRLDPTRYGDWELNGRCIDF